MSLNLLNDYNWFLLWALLIEIIIFCKCIEWLVCGVVTKTIFFHSKFFSVFPFRISYSVMWYSNDHNGFANMQVSLWRHLSSNFGRKLLSSDKRWQHWFSHITWRLASCIWRCLFGDTWGCQGSTCLLCYCQDSDSLSPDHKLCNLLLHHSSSQNGLKMICSDYCSLESRQVTLINNAFFFKTKCWLKCCTVQSIHMNSWKGRFKIYFQNTIYNA